MTEISSRLLIEILRFQLNFKVSLLVFLVFIACVVIVTFFVCAANVNGYKLYPNQELLALGSLNVVLTNRLNRPTVGL